MLKKRKTADIYEKSAKLFFQDISQYKTLSLEEERLLWEQYRNNNDLKARDKIVSSNLRFVANIAKSYQGLGLSYSDLIAEGNCGLLKALDRFDHTKGNKTISYSVWWIRQAILDALKNRNGSECDSIPEDFEKQSDEDDDTMPISFGVEQSSELLPINNITTQEMLEAVSTLMSSLTEKEQIVIQKIFALNNEEKTTLEKIGEEMGVTKERVRQIKEKAMKKLRVEALKNSITSDIYK